jgi:hypothetical protein
VEVKGQRVGSLIIIGEPYTYSCIRWKAAYLQQQSSLIHMNVESIRSLSSSERFYCPRCGLMLVKKELSAHDGHGTVQNISDSQLEKPTSLLCPIDDRKSQAVGFMVLYLIWGFYCSILIAIFVLRCFRSLSSQ